MQYKSRIWHVGTCRAAVESGHGLIAYANRLQFATYSQNTRRFGRYRDSIPGHHMGSALLELIGLHLSHGSWWHRCILGPSGQRRQCYRVICTRSKPLGTMAAHSMWLVASSLFLAIPSHLSISPAILCIWRFGSFLTLCCGFYFNGPSQSHICSQKNVCFLERDEDGCLQLPPSH